MSAPASVEAPPVAVEDRVHISRVPYLPGLDGMRAFAVVAVMVYHANSDWLPGGFLGVEMFFVISGYLITLLLIAERERNYTISLKHFWIRRARRLLPAVFTMMGLVTLWTAVFKPDALGQLRGDVIAGFFYVSNQYQIWVGLGYTAVGDFAPLRHLWSLAVEEQFYLIWPVIMVALLGRAGTRRVADVSRWVFAAAIFVTVLMAVLYYPGPIGEPNVTPDAYWWLGDRPINKIDALYLSTITRSGGLLLGAAFAMVWRPYALMRGPLRTKGRWFDVSAGFGVVLFAWMCWKVYLISPTGADSFLFRGGFFITGIVTLMVIAAITHRGAAANRLLGNRFFVYIGTRSYGLYLYHWPVYQIIRDVAGNKLNVREFAMAMVITVIITELSYRFIETPIRTGQFTAMVRRVRQRANPRGRRVLVAATAVVAAISIAGVTALATAPLEQNEIADALDDGEEFTVDLGDAPDGSGTVVDPDPAVDEEAADDDEVFTPATDAVLAPAVEPFPTTAPPTTAEAPTASTETTVPPTTAAAAAPASTAAPTTAAPTATQLGVVTDPAAITALAVPETDGFHKYIALGDSVMLGAAEELQALGFAVDAVQSRQAVDFLPTMQQLQQNRTYGSAVVVHLGTNGGFSQETLDGMMATLVDVPVVLVLTDKADRGWVAGNNAMIRALPERYPNVTVLAWEVLSQACQGNCFYDDGIHLPPDGQNYYADLIARTLGLA